MSDFPNPPRPPEWATYIAHRTTKGKFVVHSNQGHAKAAITNGCDWRYGKEDMQLLHWDGHEWIVAYSFSPGTKSKDLPWRKND